MEVATDAEHIVVHAWFSLVKFSFIEYNENGTCPLLLANYPHLLQFAHTETNLTVLILLDRNLQTLLIHCHLNLGYCETLNVEDSFLRLPRAV